MLGRFARKSKNEKNSQSRRRRLLVESLEDRRVLATFTVMDLGDAGAGTLREAVELSNSGDGLDTIVFDSSLAGQTISLTSEQLAIKDGVTISAAGLSGGIIIDASAADATPDVNDGQGIRVFDIELSSLSTASEVVTLSNLTLQGGDVDGDGGLINARSNVLIEDSILRDSHATGQGGAVFSSESIRYGTPTADILSTTISGNEAGMTGGGLFLSIRGENFARLRSVQVTDNTAADDGGGISLDVEGNSSYRSELTDVSLNGNSSAANGGGLSLAGSGANLDFTNVLVTDNSAAINGGGLHFSSAAYSSPPDLTFNNLSVTGNHAMEDGGGINGEQGLLLSNAFVFDNSADGNGGGVNLETNDFRDPIFSISNSTITGNQADGGGGGVNVRQNRGDFDMVGVTLSGNTASGGDGGGLRAIGQGQTIQVHQTTVSGNLASGSGGGIFANPYSGSLALGASATFTHVTVADNTADSDDDGSGSGGGMYAAGNYSNAITINNSILAGNDRGATVATADDISGDASIANRANNSIIQANPDVVDVSGAGLLIGVDPLLGALTANGGGIQTHLPAAGSPAIDAGDNSLTAADTYFDQRGSEFGRLRDGDNDSTATVDMGAVEALGDNTPPDPNISLSGATRIDSVVNVDASGSTDPDGPSDLTYQWTIVSMPTDSSSSIVDSTAAIAEFEGDTLGEYELLLEVSDGVQSTFEFFTLTLNENQAPTTTATISDGPYFVGATITVDASGSTDPDGDTLSYTFTPSANATIDPNNPAIATFEFTQPIGDVQITVTADDGLLDGNTQSFVIEVLEAPAAWFNATTPADTNNDGTIAPLDALLVINELTLREYSDATTGVINVASRPDGIGFLDTNNDQTIAPLDALLVINVLTEANASSALSSSVSVPNVVIPFQSDLPDTNETQPSLRDRIFATPFWTLDDEL